MNFQNPFFLFKKSISSWYTQSAMLQPEPVVKNPNSSKREQDAQLPSQAPLTHTGQHAEEINEWVRNNKSILLEEFF